MNPKKKRLNLQDLKPAVSSFSAVGLSDTIEARVVADPRLCMLLEKYRGGDKGRPELKSSRKVGRDEATCRLRSNIWCSKTTEWEVALSNSYLVSDRPRSIGGIVIFGGHEL